MPMNRLKKLKDKIDCLYKLRNKDRADWADWLHKNHVFLVADLAKKLAKRYEASQEVAAAAAMLHDIADAVMKRENPEHEKESGIIAKKLLKESDFTEKEIKIIVEDAMRTHSCYDNERPKSLEGKIMATADGMVHLQSDFYTHAVKAMKKNKSLEEISAWAVPKIDRDFNNKIMFAELQKKAETDYKKLRFKFLNLKTR